MKINRDVLILAIIRHQKSFLKLLDYIEVKGEGALEIPEPLFHKIYSSQITTDEDEYIHAQLSLSSLLENGVFIHNDKHTGMITIDKVIVDMLRFIDIKRSRELSHSDFEQMRVQSVNISELVIQSEFKTSQYNDSMKTFNGLLSEIHSKIKNNVATLHAQVDVITEKHKNYNEESAQVDLFGLLDEIRNLYERYVLPCYEFLNPTMEMKNSLSFSQSVELIIMHHSQETIAAYDIAYGIQIRKTSLTSHYKDIAELARKLESVSKHLDKDKRQFVAIESSYIALLDSLVPLRNGRRNLLLNKSASVFANHSAFDGLASLRQKYSSKFNWADSKAPLRFKEYMNLIYTSPIKGKEIALIPLDASNKDNEERQILIAKIIFNNPPKVHLENVHEYIFSQLDSLLEDFSLIDVLHGIQAFSALVNDSLITFCRQNNRMDDGVHYLDYLQIEFSPEVAHV